MPKSNAVWGIDIGQCALKAIRCEPHESDASRIVATDFDYIEYPTILSQPEADPVTLVREALEQFLSRNSVRTDHVALAVSGQSGLARFIKLPPVESSKIPDIVKYEARQQIPFSLEDVVWDYQQMAGGSEDEGFALETEVGLFAMKRDQVFRALKPLDEVEIEVDYIQLAPLAIYNAICFDLLGELPTAEDYDPDDPPESIVVISLGTENTDLVVTNGYRVWQRNIPLGGNHFTKALSKELRLTFAKAEHLKRNATQAEDPKAVFQAMRPVFNDVLTEVQRSIGFFTGIDRTAKIGRVIMLGNAVRLPGLKRFLGQNLGYDVETPESLRGLSGTSVVAAPAFKDNLASFTVCYGLCIQGLQQAKLRTNLLPPELVTERIIREKKPWAVAAISAVLLACLVNVLMYWLVWNKAHEDRYSADAFPKTNSVKANSSALKQQYSEAEEDYKNVKAVGESLTSIRYGRMLWLEVLKAIDAALPHETRKIKDLGQRRELHITSLDCKRHADLTAWFTPLASKYSEDIKIARQSVEYENGAAEAPSEGAPADGAAPADSTAQDEGAAQDNGAAPPGGLDGAADDEEVTGPSGPGWVIQLNGYHYHNKGQRHLRGAQFVRQTLLLNLDQGSVELPDDIGPNARRRQFTLRELGIGFPVLKETQPLVTVRIHKSDYELPDGVKVGPNGQISDRENLPPEAYFEVDKFEFVVQFVWQETPPNVRTKQTEEGRDGAPVVASRTAAPGSLTTTSKAIREE